MADSSTNKKELADQTHKGFEITCKKCGNHVVTVESDVRFNDEDGMWGTVWLECQVCRQKTDIFDALG